MKIKYSIVKKLKEATVDFHTFCELSLPLCLSFLFLSLYLSLSWTQNSLLRF